MTGPFTAAPHHDVLLLLIQITVLLATARLFGEIALRLGREVTAEMAAALEAWYELSGTERPSA